MIATIPILGVAIQLESDVVAARQRARQIAAQLGFDVNLQTKLATAVSEIARNAFNYGGGGRVEFSITGHTAPQVLVVRVTDSGPGIPNLVSILEGRYHSTTGMGLGIIGARRLMDQFEIVSAPGSGVAVRMTKSLPLSAPLMTPRVLARLLDELARHQPQGALGEMQQQNRELLVTLNELGARQDELVRVNSELADTNRGVVALYAELDDQAAHLRRASEMKSRFLSNMSHEFRTPLNSMLALTRLLLDRVDGELTPEQERQVYFVRKSAESLYELVNDLLDLAKVEAGKITLHPAKFEVQDLFGALRGMLRPLLLNLSVNLVFDEPEDLPAIVSDEDKVAQILRNFVSNALKFTQRGEVRVSARCDRKPDGDRVIFAVADTGIGIAPADLDRIFQEFAQVESPIQRTVKGIGLGLPLSRKLAELLGGSVTVQSCPGLGSTFSLAIPRLPADQAVTEPKGRNDTTGLSVQQRGNMGEPSMEWDPRPAVGNHRILLVDDDEGFRYLLKQTIGGLPEDFCEADNGVSGLAAARGSHPDLIFLDLTMPQMDGFHMLELLRSDPATQRIPVIVSSSQVLTKSQRLQLEGFGAAILPKDRFACGDALPAIREILAEIGLTRLLSKDTS